LAEITIPKFVEGPEGWKNFEEAMKAMFKLPKAAVARPKRGKPPLSLRKPKKSDRD
jgi:hypothetical protein